MVVNSDELNNKLPACHGAICAGAATERPLALNASASLIRLMKSDLPSITLVMQQHVEKVVFQHIHSTLRAS